MVTVGAYGIQGIPMDQESREPTIELPSLNSDYGITHFRPPVTVINICYPIFKYQTASSIITFTGTGLVSMTILEQVYSLLQPRPAYLTLSF